MDDLEQLRRENEKLRAEISQKTDKENLKTERSKKRKKKMLAWTWKLFTGKTLHETFNDWFTEFHSTKRVSANTSANLLTALVQRFVRVRLISVILLLFSLIPSLVSIYILYKQNHLIRTQNALVEGSRKSSYGFQISSIFDLIDKSPTSGNKKILNKNTIARIIGITSSLKPYKILENNELSKKPYSPERTQLLLFLLNAGISKTNLSTIFDNADFSYCDLRNTNLSKKYLVGINLENANLENVELNSSNLNEANLKGANLKGIQFSNGTAKGTIFVNADLRDAKITRTDLKDADLTNADTDDAVIN